MTTIIRCATAKDAQQWDDYVSVHQDASPYHRFAWLTATVKAYGHKNASLIALDGETVVGVFPIIDMPFPFGKPRYCALPFCDVGYVLADDTAIGASLLNKAKERAKSQQATRFECRDFQSGQNADNNHPGKVRMILALPSDSDALWDQFKSKLRSQVRKAEKNGLIAEIGNNPQMLCDFYQVFTRNMRKLGSPVHSLKWFEELAHAYGNHLHICLVKSDERTIGAGIIIRNGQKMSIPWASTLAEYNHLAPNMLLYWTVLKYSCDAGCNEFDFGRSTFGEGTFRFKLQWGAEPAPLNWQELIGEQEVPEHADTTSKLRSMVEKIWPRLPLGLTTLVGPRVRKYISL